MANLSTKARFAYVAVLCLCAAGIPGSSAPSNPAAPAPAGQGTAGREPGADFLRYWKSGLAELSSYAVTTERYGEPRRAEAVLVFVYEEINDDTRIKVESDRTPPSKRVPVLKLNNVLKFTTGIYDYSVMTSVFAGLSGPGVKRMLEPRKVSFTSQEWCGHVYHQVTPRPGGLVSEIHSYFESEGDASATLPYPAGPLYYEDEMPILVRELDGELMKAGESRRINLAPGLWGVRKRHRPFALTQATLAKAGPETRRVAGTDREAMKWTLARDGAMTSYYVETRPPRHLLAWEDDKGEKGELRKSLRKTYWELNHNRDEPLRRELGLTYGVGD